MTLARLLELGFDKSAQHGRHLSIGCSQCESAAINGVPAHEHGCPNVPAECRECGQLWPTRDDAAACCAPVDDEQRDEEHDDDDD